MFRRLLILSPLLGLAACRSTIDDPIASETHAVNARSVLDCDQPGSFDEAAMKGLPGSYVRADAAAKDELETLTVGALEDIPGWAGKTASYTRDVAAPCTDFAALADGPHLPTLPDGPLPMTTTSCSEQRGSLTTIFDNPALGAFLSFEDRSGLPAARDFYFISGSQLDAEGRLDAMCVVRMGLSARPFLLTRKK